MERLCPHDGWHTHVYEQAREEGTALGFDVDRIFYSGFYSQGDGASWSGTVDIRAWLDKHKQDDTHAHILSALIDDGWADTKLTICTRGRYSDERSMYCDSIHVALALDSDPCITTEGLFKGASVQGLFDVLGKDYVDDLCDEVLEAARDYARDIYCNLRDEYEHLCSEEVIAELCDANEYLFDEQGNFI